MYELIQVSEHDYYIQCPAASGDLQYPFQCGSYRRKQISPGPDRVQDLRAGIECDFTSILFWSRLFLYGGYPCKDLRHKFFSPRKVTRSR